MKDHSFSTILLLVWLAFPLFSIPSYVAAADLDGDLDIDVISASADDGRVIWYENTDGRGTFANGIDIDVLASASSVAAADLDNDGDIDLVVAESEDGRIVWYENMDGLATFSTANDIAEDPGVKEVGLAVENPPV